MYPVHNQPYNQKGDQWRTVLHAHDGAPCMPAYFPSHSCPHSSSLQGKRMKSFRTRTISTVGILLVFIVVIWAGHLPLLFLVLTLQVRPTSTQRQLPLLLLLLLMLPLHTPSLASSPSPLSKPPLHRPS